ncbi:MAG: hypothetical protein RLZZ215_1114 [Pseudomonadota bacterium]|jgi:amino acid efflux transporter
MLWANGVFILIYIASMLAAWRLIERPYRLAILLGLGVCLGFAWSLGSALVYALGFAAFLAVWVFANTKMKLAKH